MHRLFARVGSLLLFLGTMIFWFVAEAGVISGIVTANGEENQHFERHFSAPVSGKYVLKVWNGTESEAASSQINIAKFKINDVEINSRFVSGSFQVLDISLPAGANQVQVDYSGPARARLEFEIETKSASGALMKTSREKMAASLPEPKRVVLSRFESEDLVAENNLVSPVKTRGTFWGPQKTDFQINSEDSIRAKIQIANADGRDPKIQKCKSEKVSDWIGCQVANASAVFRRAFFRVDNVRIYKNGELVSDYHTVNDRRSHYEKVIDLDKKNDFRVETFGGVFSTATVRILELESNQNPIARIEQVDAYKTLEDRAHRAITFNAGRSTDDNDQVVSYRFQAKRAADDQTEFSSDWQADPVFKHLFKKPGDYDVVVEARDKFGAVGTTSMPVKILTNTPPVITQKYFRALNNSSPFQIRFEVRATDADPGDTLEYKFDFSNGLSTGFQSSNSAFTTFSSGGSQSADITVRDSVGATVTTTLNITVGANLIPVPSFTMSPRGAASPNTITFDASGSYDLDGYTSELRYFWTFGDGSPQVESKIATHTFDPGEWIVTLAVLDGRSGVGSLSRAVFSWVDGAPIPIYTYTQGPGAKVVNFDASASTAGDSAIATYKFDFGNGVSQTTTSPTLSYTYPNAGVYSTSLRVYDQEGDANVAGQTITVFNGTKPTANIRITEVDVMLPATYAMDAVGSVSPSSGATIAAYKWTLPGSVILTTPSITFNTGTHGNASIQLEVQDSLGVWSDPVIRTVRSIPGRNPVAQIMVDHTTVALGQAIQLNGENSYSLNPTAGLSVYEWTMPSGNKVYGPTPTVTLSQTGLKTIYLKVTDSKGYVSSSASVQVNVINRVDPVALIAVTGNDTTVPAYVHFDGWGSSTANPGSTVTGYEWKISAPTTPLATEYSMFGPEIDVVFNQATTWTVALRVFDSAGGTSSWVTETFGPTTNALPVAVIDPAGLTDVAPVNMMFNGFGSYDPEGQRIIAWHWQFSNGGEAWGPSPMHFFGGPGIYTVRLRVQDEYWTWSDPVTMTVTALQNQAPIAVASIQDVPGYRNQKSLSANGSYDSDGQIVAYNWWVNGIPGSIGTTSNLIYTFPGPGTYTVNLDVFDNKGWWGSNSSQITILPVIPPVPRFVSSIVDSPTREVSFDAGTSSDDGTIVTYRWDFPDGTHKSGVTTTHTFSNGSFATVKLTVTDDESESRSVIRSVPIQSLPVTQHEVMRCEAR